jgi:hypothetical protein
VKKTVARIVYYGGWAATWLFVFAAVGLSSLGLFYGLWNAAGGKWQGLIREIGEIACWVVGLLFALIMGGLIMDWAKQNK